MVKRTKLELEPPQKGVLYLSTTFLWISGAIWLTLAEGHSARPLWMKIHGAAAMVFLLVFGTLLAQHVPAGWKQERQRPSGISLVILCGVLAVTGWGLYYFGDESLRHWTSLAHWTIGLALPILIVLHVLQRPASTESAAKKSATGHQK